MLVARAKVPFVAGQRVGVSLQKTTKAEQLFRYPDQHPCWPDAEEFYGWFREGEHLNFVGYGDGLWFSDVPSAIRHIRRAYASEPGLEVLEVFSEGVGPAKALTVKQPWASLIAEGKKTLEIRSRPTHYRGEILICSARSPKIEPSGQALCIVDLVGVKPFEPEDAEAACTEWEPGYVAWVLAKPRPIEPFSVKGQLSFYSVALP